MERDFEPDLKGSLVEATAAKQEIAKYFKRYGDSGQEEATKHQLIFACKIMCTISKCENKHSDIYCNIITESFAYNLCPQASVKYWTLYVNCVRYIHYYLGYKKEFEKATLIYRHILWYSNKLQNIENGLTYINIYCYHLLLQNSLKAKNQQEALNEAADVVENLTKLFNNILDTNTKQNFQCPDILKKTLSYLFPQNKAVTVYNFLKSLPKEKVEKMFQSLFKLSAHQSIDTTNSKEDNVLEHAKFIMEAIYTFLQVDIIDKMQLQLSVQLMDYCRMDARLQSDKPIADSLLLLHDYSTLLCSQKTTKDFQSIYKTLCEGFKTFFENYSKSLLNQGWFGDYIILIFYLHSELQNVSIFASFWKQMIKPDCFKAMFKFFVELMKLAPCISGESKLLTINCCTSIRKHVILSFAQLALAAFMFYCQNVTEEDERQFNAENSASGRPDCYKEMIQNNLITIVNHAFKISDRMDCITSDSQEINIILTRFKQVTLNCRTSKQAATCIAICELFLKIKTKMTSKEWPLVLRRLYKTVTQLIADDLQIGREIQMCYIVSMLNDGINEIDLNQIRTQISIFYATETASTNNNKEEQQQHQLCLLHLYSTTTSLLRPHLVTSRKKLLHWLETQHIIKYYKSNTELIHSLIKSCQSHYDFILIAKLSKQQTYAMARISSLYKSLRSKDTLSRLEQLTFGHICVILLNEMTSTQKLQVDSKDLTEDQLENLIMREEMSSITIHNDLKRFELAWKAFKAFEFFYEKFDSEPISMDDAIIDWESLLDDLAGLAICLQLCGYIEHSSQVWLLHYKCARLVQDNFSALRGLYFFCEYSEYCEKNSNNEFFKLEEEIQYNFPSIMQNLENLNNLPRQAYKSYVLLAVLQIAHYYARSSRISFAQMLFQYVELKHGELSERQGRYDIVLATMDAIKFRLMWKHFNDTNNVTMDEKASRAMAENLLLHRCLLYDIEETLDRFHNFSCISSCEGLLYEILIINLVQELAECTINRLCDNFITAFFVASCKCTLMMGLALRFVQVMSMWMWMNLQMEYVDRAKVKLKIIEYVMGMRNFKELNEKSTKTQIQSSTLLPTACVELPTPGHHNTAMEAIRKLANVQLSPIKANNPAFSPSNPNCDLKRYFKCNIDTKILPKNEQIEWAFFMVGCLNARLYFLAEDYDQLEIFYEQSSKWLQMRQNLFNINYFKNIQLMVMQHYANFLRAKRQYDKALQCLEYGIELCENNNFYIDAAYSVNFKLQLIATQKEISQSQNVNFKLPTYNRLRRALQFNVSPENKQNHKTPAKRGGQKGKMLQLDTMFSAGKNSPETTEPLCKYATDGSCSSTKKIKNLVVVEHSGSSSSSLELKSTKPKTKFKICEDQLEIKENMDNKIVGSNVKSVKRSKTVEENDRMYITPKVVRKTTKSSKTTCTKRSVKSTRLEKVPQFHIDVDLTDSPPSYSLKSSTSSKNLETKENLNSNELVEKMQNLEIKSSKTPKMLPTEIEPANTKSRRKPKPIKESSVVIIVSDDSPCLENLNEIALRDKPKLHKTSIKTKDKPTITRSSSDDNLASCTRSGRQKKLIFDIADKPNLETGPPIISSTTATPKVTRRRQKNLV